MSKEKHETQNNQGLGTISSLVLAKIETEAIKPKPRMYFRVTETVIWLMWSISVLLGAVALSVTMYVGMSANYAFYEATHQNFFTFIVEVLPYVWLLIFLLTIYLSVVELRNTKRGYKYSLFTIAAGSLFLSIILGLLFHYNGLGFALDNTLGKHMTSYISMDKYEQKMWQSPEEGRLVGKLAIDSEYEGGDDTIKISDKGGTIWQVNVSELRQRDLDLLLSGKLVRLAGSSTNSSLFHACGVFPLMSDKPLGRREMMNERQEFESTLDRYTKMHRMHNQGILPPDSKAEDLCPHIAMIKKRKN